MRSTRATSPLLALCVAAGCAVATQADHAYVTAQIEQRVGHELADQRPPSPSVPPGISLQEGLTQDDAVAIALWNNPTFQAALADLGFSRADVIQAGLLTNPVFSMLFPLGPKQLEFAAKLPLEALWLRPKRLEVAETDAQAVAQRLIQGGLDLAQEAAIAFTEVRLAEGRKKVADEQAVVQDQIASIAESRLEAGDASDLEAMNARMSRRLAQADAIRAARDLDVARERLRELLGLQDSDVPLTLAADPALTPSAELDLQPLLRLASAARPDVRAAELAIEAAGERQGLSKIEFLSFAFIWDANGQGVQGFESGPGVEFGVPVFNWNQGGVARADAGLERALANYASLRQRVATEVKQALVRLHAARDELDVTAGEVLPEMERAVKIAEKAYRSGDVPLLLVLETTGQLLRAHTRQLEASADLSRARAQLERSVGGRLALVQAVS